MTDGAMTDRAMTDGAGTRRDRAARRQHGAALDLEPTPSARGAGAADALALGRRWRELLPAGVDAAQLRLVEEESQVWGVRRGVVQPASLASQRGAMVTVWAAGGTGYAASADVSDAGLRDAITRALVIAKRCAALPQLATPRPLALPRGGAWSGPCERSWAQSDIAATLDLLHAADKSLAAGSAIVDRGASLWTTRHRTLLVDADGGAVTQQFELLVPDLEATANRGTDTVRRTLAGRGLCRQGGWELLDDIDLRAEADRIGGEAMALLDAAPCPTSTCDLLLHPDQMTLQIHESIGHPLELDRILGDERNYAGTSFVRADMFGSYRYGSPLLQVTFDPGVAGEFASYGYDDQGTAAERVYLIRDGVLQRPLGSYASGQRAGLPYVANARACAWNRPPIDRMANLNVESGAEDLASLIGRTERGVWMQTNCSWSIDDSRNKFQFGCEIGWEIIDGRLGAMVRKPNYRGISATFWRNLIGVGDDSTRGRYGTPFCGKGEPNQAIRVGHASPTCLFRDVEVFGAG